MANSFFTALRAQNPNYAHLSDAELEAMLNKQYGEAVVQKNILAHEQPNLQQAVVEKLKQNIMKNKMPPKPKDMESIEDTIASTGIKQQPFDAKAYQAQLAAQQAADAARKQAEIAAQAKPVVQAERTDVFDTAAKYLPKPDQGEWSPSGTGVTPFSKVGDAVMEAIKRKKQAAQGYSTIP